MPFVLIYFNFIAIFVQRFKLFLFMDIIKRNNVIVRGQGKQMMIVSQGFGCDQNMWRYVIPAFEKDYKIVTFDHLGTGESDMTFYHPSNYETLHGYASDLVEICETLNMKEAIFVGHSVSAMIGILASIQSPDIFAHLILVGPSPRYINDDDYVGGFDEEDIEELMETLSRNYLGWSSSTAPVIMGNADRPELGEELTNRFCQMNPVVAEQFARTTFNSDNRADLALVQVPCLIMQCSEDIIAPTEVGEYMHRKIPNSELVYLKATGHCPHLSAPEETIEVMKHYLGL